MREKGWRHTLSTCNGEELTCCTLIIPAGNGLLRTRLSWVALIRRIKIQDSCHTGMRCFLISYDAIINRAQREYSKQSNTFETEAALGDEGRVQRKQMACPGHESGHRRFRHRSMADSPAGTIADVGIFTIRLIRKVLKETVFEHLAFPNRRLFLISSQIVLLQITFSPLLCGVC